MSESILQELHDSEINAELSTFWDGCFDWNFGDALNGYREQGQGRSLSGAVEHLRAAALRHYPESAFARAQANRPS